MPKIYKWTEEFIDVRDCYVLADSMEEALEKRDQGEWEEEGTINFYSNGVIEDIHEVAEFG